MRMLRWMSQYTCALNKNENTGDKLEVEPRDYKIERESSKMIWSCTQEAYKCKVRRIDWLEVVGSLRERKNQEN